VVKPESAKAGAARVTGLSSLGQLFERDEAGLALKKLRRDAGKESPTASWMPYSTHVSDTIIKTKGGDYLTVLHLEGVPFETADMGDLDVMQEALNTFLRQQGTSRVALWSHVIRRRDDGLPAARFAPGFGADLNTAYLGALQGSTRRINDLFLTLVLKGDMAQRSGLARFLTGSDKASLRASQEAAIVELEDIRRQAEAVLAPYRPYVLKIRETETGLLLSEPASFLGFLANGFVQDMPVTRSPLAETLGIARHWFGRETFALESPFGAEVFGALLSIKEYPVTTQAALLAPLLTADFEFVLTQSFCSVSRQAALERMQLQHRQMTAAKDHAQSLVDDLRDGMDDLASGRIVMGEHHATIAVLGASAEVLQDNLAKAGELLGGTGMIMAREDWAMMSAFWAQLPGNFRFRPRPALISSRNFAAFSPFFNFPVGRADGNHWGEAVTLLKTPAGSPYWFNFHVADVGNTVIIGQTGSGKTTLQTFLLAQLQKFRPWCFFFDKDRGSEIFIRAMNGAYVALDHGHPTGLAPFRALENTPQNRAFLLEFVATLVRRPGSESADLAAWEVAQISQAIDGVYQLAPHTRSLSALLEFLDQTDRDGIAARLAKWCHSASGSLAWVFDNDADLLPMDGHLVGVDVTVFLDNRDLRTPIVQYLFHRIEQLFDGRRVCIVMDEFWKLLADEAFREFARDKLKTIRKLNGFVVLATQSARDVLRSDIAHTIIEQCPTQIFLGNPRATADDYIGGFHVSAREFDLVKTSFEGNLRRFLVKQDGVSVVAELDLGSLQRELTVLSGRASTLSLLHDIIAETGTDPKDWLPELFAEMGV
jgi:type IV secretion system protein VirB4